MDRSTSVTETRWCPDDVGPIGNIALTASPPNEGATTLPADPGLPHATPMRSHHR